MSVPFFSAEGVHHETYLKSLCPSAALCILGHHLNSSQLPVMVDLPSRLKRERPESAPMNNNTTVSQLWPLFGPWGPTLGLLALYGMNTQKQQW